MLPKGSKLLPPPSGKQYVMSEPNPNFDYANIFNNASGDHAFTNLANNK
jgi:hypothetical protein